MSHYAKIAVSNMSNRKALIRALCRVGNPHATRINNTRLTPAMIEEHDKAQHLYGFRNDQRPEVANVIIRRANVGNASNDVGFVLEDGVYKPIISEYDERQGYNAAYLTRLNTAYNIESSKMELEARGIPYEELKDERGRTVIEARFEVESENRFESNR